jgi:plasmid stability protein
MFIAEVAMTTQSVTIRLPDPIYQQLKRQADRTRRSIEDELLEVVAAAVPVADELSDCECPRDPDEDR